MLNFFSRIKKEWSERVSHYKQKRAIRILDDKNRSISSREKVIPNIKDPEAVWQILCCSTIDRVLREVILYKVKGNPELIRKVLCDNGVELSLRKKAVSNMGKDADLRKIVLDQEVNIDLRYSILESTKNEDLAKEVLLEHKDGWLCERIIEGDLIKDQQFLWQIYCDFRSYGRLRELALYRCEDQDRKKEIAINETESIYLRLAAINGLNNSDMLKALCSNKNVIISKAAEKQLLSL